MAKDLEYSRRVEARLRALGYWNEARQKPDVVRFALEHGYVPSYVYRWLKGEIPRGVQLLRFARDLEMTPEELLGQIPPLAAPAPKLPAVAPELSALGAMPREGSAGAAQDEGQPGEGQAGRRIMSGPPRRRFWSTWHLAAAA